MSIVAKLAGWVAVFTFVGGWSWQAGPFNGAHLLVIVGLSVMIWAGFAALRSIDVDRLADPRPLPHEQARK
jgi:hypothetical protein